MAGDFLRCQNDLLGIKLLFGLFINITFSKIRQTINVKMTYKELKGFLSIYDHYD